ncbi:MAG: amino acid adenylation domain-containing protein [Gemmatimonadaceae bacterium]
MTKGRDHLAERRAELERRLAALTPEQRAQLDRSRGEVQTVARPAGIDPRPIGAPVPMSFAQELLWLLDRANPGMHGYNVPRTARLRGALDVAALRRALSEIVARHEVLRSTFDMVDGELRQVVHAPSEVTLSVLGMKEADAVARVRELTRRPFDLTKDSQLRSTLIRLADDDHVLLLESHHVASDAWSRNILLRELSELYDAYRTGGDVSLSPVALQYGDFAIWQRNTLQGERLETLLAYWRGQLRDAPAVLELPTDRPRPATPSFEGDARSRMLPSALLEKLRALSKANDTTLFMTLLAAFDVLLARYSGQGDIVVGSPIAGRANEGTESIIGYFANTLVLRTQLDEDPTFVELLARVREVALGAFEHQDVPYEKLVLEILRERAMGAGSAPLFQTMFTLQDAELRTMQLPGLSVEPFGSARGATKFDLSLFMHEQAGGLRAAFEFRTDLFDASTIDRMLAQLEVLLESIVAEPKARVSTLPLLPASERSILDTWSSGGTQPLEAESLYEQIALQVARTPDAIAVESEDAKLTFRELHERATVLARYLVRNGVGPDVGVGVCIERSVELVVAMLGVLKAGGYYLPLDPEYPQDRLAFMLEDAAVPIVLTESRTVAALGDVGTGRACSFISLDADWDSVIAAAPDSGTTPQPPARDNLAYVIYTSGSTGKPKGVMIPHHAVVNYLTWMRAEFPLDTRDAVLQKAPASFDACIWEFFLPLVSGARLVLARPGGHQDPAYLLEALTKHDITLLQLVPSQLQMMLETPGADGPRGLPRLRRLFLGGEALPSELLSRLAAVCPTLPVTNLYGPTEATVYASHWSIDLREWRGGAVPIGKPITGATIHLVDALRQPVPIGVPGELTIGGVGLARGYLNRPELTEEKFVRDPFAVNASGMLYRTGDRARYRADGTLEYLGRIDTQIKLRGFRVELGEIENALTGIDEVQSAVVLVREDTPGDQRLVAYVIAAPGAAQHTPHALRQQLKTSLPDFMVPTAFVWLNEWPMNANGKLDRKALAAPADTDTAIAERVAPRTPTEHAVAAIWQEILHRDVGVEDDFFELGGHSLLALRVLARIADQFGPRIPLRALFDAPTIARLAVLIEGAGGKHGQGTARITRSAQDSFPLTPAQELLWLVQRTAPGNGAYNVADQWRVRGPLDDLALSAALSSLVQRHAALRTVVEARGGAFVQTSRDARPVSVERHDLSVLDETTRAAKAHRLARELASKAFDLGRDQLLRAMLVKLAPDDHLLVTVTHHIAADGWARGIMLRDLSSAYETIVRGGSANVAEPALRYGDFALWQSGQLASGGFTSQVDRWAEMLEGASLTIDLPLDRPRPDVPRFAGAKKTVLLPLALLDKLNTLASSNDTTLYMVLLAAFHTLLHRIAVQDDVMVQTTTAGRPRAELETIVGYFASTLPVRVRFHRDTTFADALRAVREATLAGTENADVPFAELASELTTRGVVTAGTGSQVMFVMQNNEGAALKLGDATLEARGVDAGIAKMDLSLSMGEQRNGLRMALEYRTDLFDAQTAERIISELTLLLEGVAANPNRRASDYEIISANDRRQLVEQSLGRPMPLLNGRETLPASIAHFCETSPQLPAFEEEGSGRVVTYGEIAERASRIAATLRDCGITRGDIVAVHGNATIETFSVILGVLAAGAAYTPLDPEAPVSRLEYLITDSRAKLVVVDAAKVGELRSQLANGAAANVPLMDARELIESTPASTDPEALANGARPEELAYVLYTSGSTGKPKGVEIEHRHLANHEAWIQGCHHVGPGDVVLAVSALSFDPSVTELFGTLAMGACLLLARPDMRRDPRYVLDVVRRRKVATLESVPSILRLLVDSVTEPVEYLRHLFVGGEAMPPDLPRAVKRAFPNTVLHNGYGPTEATIDSCWFVLAPHTFDQIEARGVVPIGKAIGGARAYVVEPSGALAPPGVSGELWVGGAGVGRGYLGRPELTAEKFIADPFAEGRVYRTGDRVRWNSDGQLDFLGRLDDQVKIGGVRIEPGEVEGVLATQPDVREVCVLTRGEGANKQLVAYVAGNGVTTAALRAFARNALPPAMVPAAFVVLDRLPRNPAGKVDRPALPLPDVKAFDRAEFVAPGTATEIAVASIMSDVLRHERVGAEDSFFDLGGNSLAAMRIVARMQEASIGVPLHAIFERGTVARIAALADELRAAPAVEAGITRVARGAYRRERVE